MNARTSFGYRRWYEDLDALFAGSSEPVITDASHNYRSAKTIAGALRKAAECRRRATLTTDPDFRAFHIADAKGWLATAGMMNDTNRYCDTLDAICAGQTHALVAAARGDAVAERETA